MLVAVALLVVARDTSGAQSPPAPRDFAAEIKAATREATVAAGREFPLTALDLCYLAEPSPLDTVDAPPPFARTAEGFRERPREAWYVEPARVFDNLYFVGDVDQSAWILTTSKGMILLDTNIPFRTESVIIEGMRKLGLDPRDIKYVVVSHAHGDHLGGARELQDRFGAKVVMSAADWEYLAHYPKRNIGLTPRRDITATNGGKVTLGEVTVTTWLTPGHTPGTMSFTFPVSDRGKQLNVVYSGGTGFNFPNNTPELGIPAFQTYIDSQKRLSAKAVATGATVFLTNHSWNDNVVNKIRMMPGRGAGPSPFEIGTAWIERYFKTTAGCARAAQLRLEQRGSESQAH